MDTTDENRASTLRRDRRATILLLALVLAGSVALLVIGDPWLRIAGAGGITFSTMALGIVLGSGARGVRMRPAMRRYNRRLAVTMSVYVVALFGAVRLYELGLTDGPLGYLVALAPALPIVGVFVILALFLREEGDELMRRVVMEMCLWAGMLTLAEATLWGFLETLGKVPHVWLWAVPVAFFVQLGVAGPLVGRRYR